MGGGVLVVFVLCGGGFCVDSGEFLWVLVCGWWWIFYKCWCVGEGGFSDIKFVWKLRKCDKLVGK